MYMVVVVDMAQNEAEWRRALMAHRPPTIKALFMISQSFGPHVRERERERATEALRGTMASDCPHLSFFYYDHRGSSICNHSLFTVFGPDC